MADYTVTILSDVDDPNDGEVSIREAVTKANLTDAEDTITFASGLNGSITLGQQLDIQKDLIIDGDGRITLDGGNDDRVVEIRSNVDADLIGLTITGGSSSSNGGGILVGSESSLELVESTVIGNSASGSGGGIAALRNSDVTVVSSLIADNSSGNQQDEGGGGIFIERDSQLSITNSTIHGNSSSARYGGGGIFVDERSDVDLISSTVTGNSTSSGVGGGVTLYDGNINATLTNSIISGNQGGNTGIDDLAAYSRNSSSPSFNIVDNSSLVGGNASLIFETTTALPNGNPAGALNSNGVVPLNPNGIAINVGDNSFAGALTVDQLGNARIAGGTIDPGAAELQNPPVIVIPPQLVVNTSGDELDGDFTQLSLREALFLSQLTPGADTITFDHGNALFTVTLSNGELTPVGDVTLEGDGLVTIDAAGGSRVMSVTGSETSVSLSGLTLTGGRTSATTAEGGGIRVGDGASLRIEDSLITGNQTTGGNAHGGGIFVEASAGTALTVIDSTISNNSAVNAQGGGVARTLPDNTSPFNPFTADGDVTIVNSTINDNVSGDGGGGLAFRGLGDGNDFAPISDGELILQNVTIANNQTTGNSARGGGLAVTQSAFSSNYVNNVTLHHLTVTGNSTIGSNAQGGGVEGTNITLTNSLILGNVASGRQSTDYEVAGSITNNNSQIGGSTSGVFFFDDPIVDANDLETDVDGGRLANNGGDTQTVSLLFVNGIAVDEVSEAQEVKDILDLDGDLDFDEPLPFDQRGFPRENGDAVDRGAFEFDPDNEAPEGVEDPLIVIREDEIATIQLRGDPIDPNDGVLDNDKDDNEEDVIDFSDFFILSDGKLIDNKDGTLGYDPSEAFAFLGSGDVGDDKFTYTITDLRGGLALVEQLIEVIGVNSPPDPDDVTVSVNEGESINFDILSAISGQADIDPDDDDAVIQFVDNSVVQNPANSGLLQQTGSSISFDTAGDFETLAQGETAEIVLTYQLKDDGDDGTATPGDDTDDLAFGSGTVIVEVIGRNDDPAAQPDNAESPDETTPFVINVLANDTDIDGDKLSVTIDP